MRRVESVAPWQPVSRMSRGRALFLDRDGVINADTGYVHRVEDFVFLEGVFEACRRAQALGFRLVVATNQSGIGRGLYDDAAFAALTRWMLDRFAAEGVADMRVYHEPSHPTAGQGAHRRASMRRKPAPGMLLEARDELALDLAASALVGDGEDDIAAGRAAGIGRLIRIASGPTPPATAADHVCASLLDAVAWLEGVEGAARES